MLQVIIPEWPAIEFVCKIICKYKKLDFDKYDFKNPEFLREFLRKCIAPEFSDKIAQAAFGSQIHRSKYTSSYRQTRAFHTLISQVRLGREVKMPKTVFKKFKDYIKEKDFASQLIEEKKARDITTKRAELVNKSYEFFYYFTEPDIYSEGVVNGHLQFSLTDVTLSIFDSRTQKIETFKGLFEIHKIYDGFVLQLNFKMRTIKASEKKQMVNFSFCFGEYKSEYAFGVMYQLNPKFACANIIAQKVKYKDFSKNVCIKYAYKKGKPDIGKISPLMWEFFMLYKTDYIQEMPILNTSNEYSIFLTDYIEIYKQNRYPRKDLQDFQMVLLKFEDTLGDFLSKFSNNPEAQKLFCQFSTIYDAYSISQTERTRNPSLFDKDTFSSWFQFYYDGRLSLHKDALIKFGQRKESL